MGQQTYGKTIKVILVLLLLLLFIINVISIVVILNIFIPGAVPVQDEAWQVLRISSLRVN